MINNCFCFSNCPLSLVPPPFCLTYLWCYRVFFLSSHLRLFSCDTCSLYVNTPRLFIPICELSVNPWYSFLATKLFVMYQNWSSSSDPSCVLLQGITFTAEWPAVDIWSLSFTWESLKMPSPFDSTPFQTQSGHWVWQLQCPTEVLMRHYYIHLSN